MTKAQKKLPDMNHWTLEQIAQFWNTHSSADYWDDMEDANFEIGRRPLKSVTLKLSDQDIEKLRRIAEEEGIGHTTLVRMWVKEKLHQASI